MAESAKPKLGRNAFTMILLMFMSVMVGIATAEVTDGDGTTGIDRNPGASEQDGASIARQLDGVLSLIHISEPTRPERIGVGGIWV